MRPDFSKIDYRPTAERTQERESEQWLSPEHVPIKSFYTHGDLEGLEHLEYAAGTRTLFARTIQHDVCHASLDDSPICRLFHC